MLCEQGGHEDETHGRRKAPSRKNAARRDPSQPPWGACAGGTHSLDELKEKAVFIRVTNNGLIEGHPHDISIVKDAPNYQKR